MTNKNKIFHLVTVSKSTTLMKGQIEYLREKGLDVHIVTSQGPELNVYPSCITHIVSMKREISLVNDIKSLMKMVKLFAKEKPRIVNSGTPKAALIGTLAGFITRRPVRIYTVRGLRLETESGIKYKILYLIEKLIMLCATDVIAISESLKNRIVSLGLENANNIKVLGNGSSNGLNLNNFTKNKKEIKSSYKKKLEGYFVIGFVGRIVEDKGINEMVNAFKNIQEKGYKAKLLVVGEIERNDSVSEEILKFLKENEHVVLTGHVSNTVNYYNNMDVLVFPTHREGFGNVSIEAQAVEVPVITTNVTGAKDTVINDETGYIVEKGDYIAMAEKLELLINRPQLKSILGVNGRKRVETKFVNEIVWKDLEQVYRDKINN